MTSEMPDKVFLIVFIIDAIKGLFHLHSRYVVQILVDSHFELVSSLLALDATEPVSQPVTQLAVEMINIHLISVQQKR